MYLSKCSILSPFIENDCSENNTVEPAANSHHWTTGKVTIPDKWLFIGGSFSGGSRAPPPPPPHPFTIPKTKNAHIWAERCSRMHHLKPWMSLENLGRWLHVCKKYCTESFSTHRCRSGQARSLSVTTRHVWTKTAHFEQFC